jgi:O-antigen ligase
MKNPNPSPRDAPRLTLFPIAILIVCIAALVASAGISIVLFRDMQTQTRGVTYGAQSNPPLAAAPIGVNVSLDQYMSEADLRRALESIHGSRFYMARQHFYWSEIEPRRGEFQWDKWDRIVNLAGEYELELTAVLDTTPVWARDPGEADLVNAPPANVDDYSRFVAALVQRYGTRINHIQLWDNPNIHPFWGRRNADPGEYTALLRAGAQAARRVNPAVYIISAGLAPNDELIRGHPDYSDVLFLRGMYDAGARDDFDILGAKPYGMWTGPDDRRVDMSVFNFSRSILLREEMVAHGDAYKPVWAVEFGWNALPPNWQGAPSPWGTDKPEVQKVRLASAVQRARGEWPWMTAMIVQTFQPDAPSDDPVWGFALFDKKFQPTPLSAGLANVMSAPIQTPAFDFGRFYALLAALAAVAMIAAWRGAVAASRIPWASGWFAIESRFTALPEPVQFAALAVGAAAFYLSPNVVLNFVLLAVLLVLFAFRLDLGLAVAVFTIPFYLLPKTLFGSAQFSLVELLTLVAAAAWAVRQVTRQTNEIASAPGLQKKTKTSFAQSIGRLRSSLLSADLGVVFFVLIGILSVKMAGNFGVASREFRVIVFEPAVLYGLIRAANLTRRDLVRLVDAFILSAVAVSLIGLYQYGFTNWVIIGEGVRRVLAVYGSPNNLALYLDRALPLVIALAAFVDARRRRIAYALSAVPIALAIYLTYSRGAWLIGLPAGLLFIGLFSGRRVRLAIAALLVIGVIALVPFSQTDRFKSLFQEGTGTGFFRVSVWESGIAMIRDHPVFGVGLDNFLYEYPRYIQSDAWREPNLAHPHNIVLDFWVRMGVLGMVALGWLLFEFYRAGFKKLIRANRPLVLGLMASMTAALAHGMIDAAYFYVDLAFVFMLTFAVIVELGDGSRSTE